MSPWFDHYKNSMYASRFVGITAAMLLVFCVIDEISRLYTILSVSETVEGVAVRNALYVQHYVLVVGVLALWRNVVLAWSRSHSYAWQILSWWLLAFSILCYLSAAIPDNRSDCPDGRVCFAVYDLAKVWGMVGLAGLLFILGSVARFLVTILLVTVLNRGK